MGQHLRASSTGSYAAGSGGVKSRPSADGEDGHPSPAPTTGAVIMKPIYLHYDFIERLTRGVHTWEYSRFGTWTTP